MDASTKALAVYCKKLRSLAWKLILWWPPLSFLLVEELVEDMVMSASRGDEPCVSPAYGLCDYVPIYGDLISYVGRLCPPLLQTLGAYPVCCRLWAVTHPLLRQGVVSQYSKYKFTLASAPEVP